MSQAEDLLNILSESVPEHTHSMADSDNAFVIDPVTRTIKNMTGGPLILMQRDHKSSVYTFKLPRYIDGHDMSLCNRVKCHFNNIETNENTGETFEHADDMELTDLRVDPEDETSVICSWTIPRQATWYAGVLGFLLQYLCVDDAGNETYEWHTDEFTDIVVKKSRNNDYVVLEYSAIFEQWRERIFGAGDSVKNELIALTDEKLEAIESEGTTWVEAVESEGSEQVKSVNSTGAAQVEAIANEGLRVFNTIPEDYTAMSEQVGMLTSFAGPVIRQEVEGKSIVVKDSARMPLLGLQMFGKSSQETTKGYQLCDMSRFPDFTAWSTTVIRNGDGTSTTTGGGVTVVNNGDGSLTISGSGEIAELFSARFDLTHEETLALLKAGELYCNYGATTVPKLYIQLNNSSGTLASMNNQNLAEASITVTQEMLDDEELFLRFSFYQMAGDTIVPGTIKPMVYQDGYGTWEEFSGGLPSPNPEYPQEIVSVENSITYVYGKNMLDISQALNANFVENDDIYTLTRNDGGERFSGEVSLHIPANTPFKVSMTVVKSTNSSARLPLYFRGVSGKTYYASVTTEYSCLYNEEIVSVGLYLATSEEVGSYISFRDLQIELGENVTDYEAYKSIQTLSSSCTLPGLPVESGGNYTDENGQQYIANYRDWERGVDVQNVYTRILKGVNDEVWNPYNNNVDQGASFVCWITPVPKEGFQLSLCDKFRNVDGAWGAPYKGQCGIYSDHDYANGKYFRPPNDTIVTMDEWKKWLTDNNVTITYVLKNPIETPIPEAELQAYRELRTNYPNTTILNDSGAHMKLAYATDTKMYIDNKFAELQAVLTKES